MDAKNVIIEMLKQKRYISPLEQDILETWDELQKYPFDLNSAQQKVISNDVKYPDVFLKVNALPTTVSKPIQEITERDVRYILSSQLDFLLDKERSALNNGR